VDIVTAVRQGSIGEHGDGCTWAQQHTAAVILGLVVCSIIHQKGIMYPEEHLQEKKNQ